MPYIEVNGANLYYETFGKEAPGKAPVVLIHGSTGTGRSNWAIVAPLLARKHYVIVPDCRGHGKSSNPSCSYSFKEMSDDIASLVRALGFTRAHVIGHSNGGNVATVILLEHPEVVQTAILQAANAYVSPDLVEKEPPLFDPEFVERESPEWMRQMIVLHGETHGPEYWRDLLHLTVQEIITEPNYTPEDLQLVRRPTLVIQGENDRVNAPYKHAQFIARYIPDAELWIPEGIGHNVQDEILYTWIEKVLDFIDRRGDDENDALYRLGRRVYQDGRDWIYAVRAEVDSPGILEKIKLSGKVLTEEQRRAVLDLFPGREKEDRLQVFITSETPWALIHRNVTDLRREPSRFSERISQALLGEAVRILEEEGEWARVRLEHDGYLGWLRANSLYRCKQKDVERYHQAANSLVAADVLPFFNAPDSDQEAGKLPFGVHIPVIDRRDHRAVIQLPDGRCMWASSDHLLSVDDLPRPDPVGKATTLEYIRRFIGVPYLWGGRTPFGFDCSGLAQAYLRFMGLNARRDANQQFETGMPVKDDFLPGDLLFFGDLDEANRLPGDTGEPPRRISHVAISVGGDELIHSSGGPDCVTYNSLNPESPLYYPWLKENLAGARRYE